MPCSINDSACSKGAHIEARGLCHAHYARLRKWGDPHHVARAPHVRFWAKVNKTDGCWLWTGAVSDTGYGSFNTGSGYAGARRFAYILQYGPVADGLWLDHLCRIRRCVNPAHLEPVTPEENTRRGMRIGHPFQRAADVRQRSRLVRGSAQWGWAYRARGAA